MHELAFVLIGYGIKEIELNYSFMPFDRKLAFLFACYSATVMFNVFKK
jgi:hypothetical protein